MTIYAIGNSHAHLFTGSPPQEKFGWFLPQHPFRSVSIGPVIAFNFLQNHLPVLRNLLFSGEFALWFGTSFNPEKDFILLVVGEVDCRWHIPSRAAQTGRDVLSVTAEVVERFFQVHLQLVRNGFHVVAWGNHPSTLQGEDHNPNRPVYGDVFLRNTVSRFFHDSLETLSKEHPISFLSIYDYLVDEHGLTKMGYFQDYCHLNSKLCLPLILEKLDKLDIST